MVTKVLTFDTVMGQVLKPTKLVGQEGMSIPFSYQLDLVSNSADVQNLALMAAASLIGTMARVGLHTGPADTQYTYRTGMISRFERTGVFNPGGTQDNLSVYSVTLVPAVQMLGRQSAFRVFENKSVVDIIKALLSDMRSRFPDFLYDMSRVIASDFEPMEYCVQFGESTFGFLSRLMNRFGLWYAFDKPTAAAPAPGSDPPVALGNEIMQASNTMMVIGSLPFPGIGPCDVSDHTVTDDDPSFKSDDPKSATISNFERRSTPVLQDSWYGNFNILNPTAPLRFDKKFYDPNNNVLVANKSVGGFFHSEEFPGVFESPTGNGAAKFGEVDGYAVGPAPGPRRCKRSAPRAPR